MKRELNRKVMPETMSVTEISQNASAAIDRVIELNKTQSPLVILRHNKPVAVMLGVETYDLMHEAYLREETEAVTRMFEERGIKRENLKEHIETMSSGPFIPWEEVKSELGLTQADLDAVDLAEEHHERDLRT